MEQPIWVASKMKTSAFYGSLARRHPHRRDHDVAGINLRDGVGEALEAAELLVTGRSDRSAMTATSMSGKLSYWISPCLSLNGLRRLSRAMRRAAWRRDHPEAFFYER